MIIDEEVYLEHFGIKGMKWGIRNKKPQPRPDYSGMTKAEKSAAMRQRAKEKARRQLKVEVAKGLAVGIPLSYGYWWVTNYMLTGGQMGRQIKRTAKDAKKYQDHIDRVINLKGKIPVATLSDAAKKNALDVREVTKHLSLGR